MKKAVSLMMAAAMTMGLGRLRIFRFYGYRRIHR